MVNIRKARALALVLGGGAALALVLQGLLSITSPMQSAIKSQSSNGNETKQTVNYFSDVTLEARSAYVFDIKTNTVLFAKNENEKLPLASVTKLMTAFLAREMLPESSVLTISRDDLATEGDSGLRTGERWRMEDLLNLMLLISSNDAAHAIASFVGANGQGEGIQSTSDTRQHFVQMMNEKAKELNLDQMEFFNESGLDVDKTINGGYGSAHNVAELFVALWKKYPETVAITAHKDARIYSQDNIAHILPNTNEVIGHIPGLIASKTGYTVLAGGNLAVIFDRGMGDPVVAVVLGSSFQGRFDDVEKLVSATIKTGDQSLK